jgi:hypothetical protein
MSRMRECWHRSDGVAEQAAAQRDGPLSSQRLRRCCESAQVEQCARARRATIAYRHTLELIYKDQSNSDRIAAFRFLA